MAAHLSTDMELNAEDGESFLDKRKQATLVMMTLKANHPMSDILIIDLFKAVNIGVDFSTLSNSADVKELLSCSDPATVRNVTFCVNCGAAVDGECTKEKYALPSLLLRKLTENR